MSDDLVRDGFLINYPVFIPAEQLTLNEDGSKRPEELLAVGLRLESGIETRCLTVFTDSDLARSYVAENAIQGIHVLAKFLSKEDLIGLLKDHEEFDYVAFDPRGSGRARWYGKRLEVIKELES